MPDPTPIGSTGQWSIRSATMDAGRIAMLKDDVVKALESLEEDNPKVPATDVYALLCHMEHRAEVLMQRDRDVVELRAAGDVAAGRIKDLQAEVARLMEHEPPFEEVG